MQNPVDTVWELKSKRDLEEYDAKKVKDLSPEEKERYLQKWAARDASIDECFENRVLANFAKMRERIMSPTILRRGFT